MQNKKAGSLQSLLNRYRGACTHVRKSLNELRLKAGRLVAESQTEGEVERFKCDLVFLVRDCDISYSLYQRFY